MDVDPASDYVFNFIFVPILYDSTSAIGIAKNTIQHSQTKHINRFMIMYKMEVLTFNMLIQRMY